jgi:hypothetical protein
MLKFADGIVPDNGFVSTLTLFEFQFVKAFPGSATAVSVYFDPAETVILQTVPPVPQLIPAGSDVTMPCVGCGLMARVNACTVAAEDKQHIITNSNTIIMMGDAYKSLNNFIAYPSAI